MLDLNACNQQKKERNKLRVVPDYLCGQVHTQLSSIQSLALILTTTACHCAQISLELLRDPVITPAGHT